jgi:hypothetical protein
MHQCLAVGMAGLGRASVFLFRPGRLAISSIKAIASCKAMPSLSGDRAAPASPPVRRDNNAKLPEAGACDRACITNVAATESAELGYAGVGER